MTKLELLQLFAKFKPSPNLDIIFLESIDSGNYLSLVGKILYVQHHVRPITINFSDIDEFTLFKNILKKYPTTQLVHAQCWDFSYEGAEDLGPVINDDAFNYKLRFFASLLISQNLALNINAETVSLEYINGVTSLEEVNELYEFIESFSHSKKGGNVYIIMNSPFEGNKLKSFKLDVSDVPLLNNYNADFIKEHEKILSYLTNPKGKGMILLHGLPGTGKSYYIKYLTKLIPEKKFIYLPQQMSNMLTGPGGIDFMMQHSGAILILEDAEKIIRKREGGSDASTILNTSDGILSDLLKMQIICTFNCDVEEIDEAILRSGRLISKYKFGLLGQEKAKTLAQELGKQINIVGDTLLADIYNADNVQGVKKEEVDEIGFRKYVL